MKRYLYIFTPLLLLMFMSRVDAGECQITGYSKEPVCLISMIRLVATPERYEKRIVVINVVARKIPGGGVELYYSKESFRQQLGIESAYVKQEEMGDFFNSIKTGDRINIIGEFNISHPATDTGLHFGTIRDILLVTPDAGPIDATLLKNDK